MFATLIGPYPQIDGTPQERLMATIADQLEAGLGMLTDGQVHAVAGRDPAGVVGAWRAADAVGHHLAAVAGIEPPLIKACLVGPWTTARAKQRPAMDTAIDLVPVIAALFEAGVPVVQLTEPAIGFIDPADLDSLELLEAVLGIVSDAAPGHVSLALAGGPPTGVPYQRLFASPFASYLFDLVSAPDDWNLCARAPGTGGLIVAVADARTPDPDTEAVSVWGARYAASLGGRGPGRVGLAMSAGLELLPRDMAKAKLAALAEAGRKAELSNEELAQVIDPRAVDARSAGLGRYEPRRPGS
ncbi:MAG: hypothetical protein LH650_02395 [Chloroflexi bacterium]|nr:hypothetical protein [Chloroflexota bacterium]